MTRGWLNRQGRRALALLGACLALGTCMGLGGCINASTLQTARTLPPGDVMVRVGGGSTQPLGQPKNAGLDLSNWYYGEMGARYGLMDALDVGANLTLLGTGGLDVKYQFLDEEDLAVASGLGLAYLQMEAGSGDQKVTSTILDVTVPVYVSYDLGSHLTAYTAPKYLLRAVFGTSATNTHHNAGGTVGLKLGDSAGLFVESSFLRDLTGGYNQLQFNASIYWSR